MLDEQGHGCAICKSKPQKRSWVEKAKLYLAKYK